MTETPEPTPNQYNWNAVPADDAAAVLHWGFHALCEQLAILTDAIRGVPR